MQELVQMSPANTPTRPIPLHSFTTFAPLLYIQKTDLLQVGGKAESRHRKVFSENGIFSFKLDLVLV